MKSVADIPELRLSKIQKLIERFKTAPSMVLTRLFGEDKWDSDDIYWESEYGNMGMTPLSGENVEAPRVAPTGTATHTAKAAFWKEKMYLGSKFLNNIRQPGTTSVYYRATKYLAQQTLMLRNRCDRRKEWLTAKMLSDGAIAYKDPDANSISVDYGLSTINQVALSAKRKWDYVANDSEKNILEDIMDAQLVGQNSLSTTFNYALFTQEVLNLMVLDTGIQTLLKKSSFGEGDLFARPIPVLGSLLNIPNMVLYDESYQIRAWLTSAVSAGAGPHTIYGDDLTDFEVGMTLNMVKTSLKNNNIEQLTITAVDPVAGTITATGTLTRAYAASQDFCFVSKKFLPTNKFILFADRVEGQKIAEFALAPFDLDRHYGMKVDRHDKWDPDGVFVRVQNKGLPVLYFPEAIFQYTVK
jgi:hypothetical protein